MKVLNVIPYFSPIYGGPPQIVKYLSQAEAALGMEVDVVTTDADGDRALPVPLQTWQWAEGYRVQYFPRRWLRQYTISPALGQWLRCHVRDYDLVHLQNAFAYPVWSVYQACAEAGVPYIRTPQGMLEPRVLAQKRWKKQLFLEAIERRSFKAAALVQALTHHEAKGIRQLGLDGPIQVIPNGIARSHIEQPGNPDEFWQTFPHLKGKPLILYLARIDPLKGLDVLVKALGLLHPQMPEAHLVIAGSDLVGYQPTIEQLLGEVGCPAAATFTGLLTGSLKHAALAAASVYVSPSQSEGFSVSVLEAMGSGLPVVITTGCHFPEAAQAEAAIEVPVEVEAIAHALLHCLQNPHWAKAMGDRAQHLICHHYTWDAIARQFQQIFEHLVRSPSSSSTALGQRRFAPRF